MSDTYDDDIVTIIRRISTVEKTLIGAFGSVSMPPSPSFGYRLPEPKKPRNPKKAAQKAQRMARKANRR